MDIRKLSSMGSCLPHLVAMFSDFSPVFGQVWILFELHLGICYTSVSQVDNKENWDQLDQEFERNEKGLHDRATWKSVPKWTYTNVGKPFRFAAAHQLYILEGLLYNSRRCKNVGMSQRYADFNARTSIGILILNTKDQL